MTAPKPDAEGRYEAREGFDPDALMTHREALELRDAAYAQGYQDAAAEVRTIVGNALGVVGV